MKAIGNIYRSSIQYYKKLIDKEKERNAKKSLGLGLTVFGAVTAGFYGFMQ